MTRLHEWYMTDITNYVSIGVALLAVTLSIGGFLLSYSSYLRGKKTEQVKIAKEISSELNKVTMNLNKISGSMGGMELENRPDEAQRLREELQEVAFERMKIWEFFAFLANTRLLDNEEVLNYFSQKLDRTLGRFFVEYPEMKNSNEFAQLRKYCPQKFSEVFKEPEDFLP
jgi:hypothetical protein